MVLEQSCTVVATVVTWLGVRSKDGTVLKVSGSTLLRPFFFFFLLPHPLHRHTYALLEAIPILCSEVLQSIT